MLQSGNAKGFGVFTDACVGVRTPARDRGLSKNLEIAVPGWFGWENQGGGIAVADLNGNGAPDLVVFHIDNPEFDNVGYYRVGWDVQGGNVTGGCTPSRIRNRGSTD